MRVGFVLDGTVIAFLLLGSACGRTADHDGDTDGDTGSSETHMSDTGTSDTGGCLADELFCDGMCVADDEANCGECGNQCGVMYHCQDGECRHNCDEGGGDYCDGECVFVDEDDQHCGQCNNPCGPGESCESTKRMSPAGSPKRHWVRSFVSVSSTTGAPPPAGTVTLVTSILINSAESTGTPWLGPAGPVGPCGPVGPAGPSGPSLPSSPLQAASATPKTAMAAKRAQKLLGINMLFTLVNLSSDNSLAAVLFLLVTNFN